MKIKPLLMPLVTFICALAIQSIGNSQIVQKMADLVTGQDIYGNGTGPSVPECRFTVVGTNLWFTSNAGGAAGFGGMFYFDLSNSNIMQVGTLDNNSGKNPVSSSLVVADGQGWFTTSAGGTGNKGSLCSIDLTNFTISNVFNFPTNPAYGWAPRSTPVQIGDDLWFTTSSGGLPPDGSTVYGAIVKYNIPSGTMSNMLSLDNTNFGRQPLGNSLVKAGNAYYYLTFAGGITNAFGSPNGSGVLGKLTFNSSNQPVFDVASDLPGRFMAFPGGDVVYDNSNYLYFTTAGVSSNSGAIVRFGVNDGTLTSLFNFVTNAVATTNYGKQPYGTPVLYNNELYFTTLSGGTSNKGVLDKLSLSNNLVTKLADFEGATDLALGASPQYGSGTLYTNPVDARIGIYFPINRGGLNNNNGTIVRVLMPPPPIVATLSPSGAETVTLSWTGGYGPFSVDAKLAGISGPWTSNWLSNLTINSVAFAATNSEAYFRVEGQSQ